MKMTLLAEVTSRKHNANSNNNNNNINNNSIKNNNKNDNYNSNDNIFFVDNEKNKDINITK